MRVGESELEFIAYRGLSLGDDELGDCSIRNGSLNFRTISGQNSRSASNPASEAMFRATRWLAEATLRSLPG